MSEFIQSARSVVGEASQQETLAVVAADGARSELLLVRPAGEKARQTLYWLPALGVPARHYLPLARALAARGVAVSLHEWRGIGSSDRRAGRQGNWSYRHLLADDIPAGMAALRAHAPSTNYRLGGHSLGGQLACLYASLYPDQFTGIALVASGAPYWRMFRHAGLLYTFYLLAPKLVDMIGYLPGRKIGFGGNEARGLIADWARSGRRGRYAVAGMDVDFERRLAALKLPVLGLRLDDDKLAPSTSLEWLLGKMPQAVLTTALITAAELGSERADHFNWMKNPDLLAARIGAWIAA